VAQATVPLRDGETVIVRLADKWFWLTPRIVFD
jgi:hypothetical protein